MWEAVADPAVAGLGEVLWVVDVNRQSLDRVVPDVQVHRLEGMFEAAGWQVLTLAWGRTITSLFERPGGADLRRRLESMPNEEYQRMLRADPAELPDRILGDDASAELTALVGSLSVATLAEAVRDLGGHDLDLLVDTFRHVDTHRPTVVLAYTIKGRGLPIEGHPANHSALLTEEQMVATPTVDALPVALGRSHRAPVSTQAALGRFLVDLTREAPQVAGKVVTCSPDVASSTNLGGWINKTGVWSAQDRRDWFADDAQRTLRWAEGTGGQHIELGIAEVNLVGLLGELGTTWSRWGERLIPLATLYDPFVARALEPWSYGMYAGGQSILVGTPSGVTLAPEGGAHQSITTPSIGLEQPGCVAWEPAFRW